MVLDSHIFLRRKDTSQNWLIDHQVNTVDIETTVFIILILLFFKIIEFYLIFNLKIHKVDWIMTFL